MNHNTTQSNAWQMEATGVLNELADLEQRLHLVEAEVDRMQETDSRQKRDSITSFERGDIVTVVVLTPPEENDRSHAVTKLNGVVTFVDPGNVDLQRGDAVRARIYDIGERHLDAIAINQLGDSQ